MAGSNPAFDPAAFRAAIRQTMQMAMPTNPGERLTWRWKRVRTFEPDDDAGNPYDWGQSAVTDDPGNPDEPGGSKVVDYALEFSSRPAGSQETVFGQIDTSRAVVTLLDVDYELIQTADFCTINGAEYEIDFSGPPMGMFEVTVYQIFLTAVDEQ